MIEIFGAKGKIKNIDNFLEKIQKFSDKKNVKIQCFNADMIYGKKHLLSSTEHAIRSFNQKTNTTGSLQMEILLYASGERQLKLAIPKMGVKQGNVKIAFVMTNNDEILKDLITELLEELDLRKDDSVLKGDKSILKSFGISETEIKTVSKDKYEDLILEKVAMVDIIK